MKDVFKVKDGSSFVAYFFDEVLNSDDQSLELEKFLRKNGNLTAVRHTPSVALWINGAWVSLDSQNIIVVSKDFDDVIFILNDEEIFYILFELNN